MMINAKMSVFYRLIYLFFFMESKPILIIIVIIYIICSLNRPLDAPKHNTYNTYFRVLSFSREFIKLLFSCYQSMGTAIQNTK